MTRPARKRREAEEPQPTAPPALRSADTVEDYWRMYQQASHTAEVEASQAQQLEDEEAGRRRRIAELNDQLAAMQHQIREETRLADEASTRAGRHRTAQERAQRRKADHADRVTYDCEQLGIQHPAERPPLPVEAAAATATGVDPTSTGPNRDARSGPEIAADAKLASFNATHDQDEWERRGEREPVP